MNNIRSEMKNCLFFPYFWMPEIMLFFFYRFRYFGSVIAGLLLFFSCGEDMVTYPRPMGYFRISFPTKEYALYEVPSCPFVFAIPKHYSQIFPHQGGSCWYDIEFVPYKATLHITYKKIENNLPLLLEDSRSLVMKHIARASDIEENLVMNTDKKIFGTVYHIKGNVGTGIQFHLTDSVHHFVRGSLYFNIVPNADSLAPVADFLEKDVYQFIQTFEWK